MRGRRRAACPARPRRRSTPARAGPTRSRPEGTSTAREHPRACGADVRPNDFRTADGGAPPRVRGRRDPDPAQVGVAGSTPARAGPTRSRRRARQGGSEHPRACGADELDPTAAAQAVGAPPRVRGRPMRERLRSIGVRSTPARAGPTGSSRPGWPIEGEHPRACGADAVKAWHAGRRGGAPPRVRGRRARADPHRAGGWSTPARAGPTRPAGLVSAARREHPRACGADGGLDLVTLGLAGAPPRVRGRLPRGPAQRRAARSTPRACGADRSRAQPSSGFPGAPPRVRGRRQSRFA